MLLAICQQCNSNKTYSDLDWESCDGKIFIFKFLNQTHLHVSVMQEETREKQKWFKGFFLKNKKILRFFAYCLWNLSARCVFESDGHGQIRNLKSLTVVCTRLNPTYGFSHSSDIPAHISTVVKQGAWGSRSRGVGFKKPVNIKGCWNNIRNSADACFTDTSCRADGHSLEQHFLNCAEFSSPGPPEPSVTHSHTITHSPWHGPGWERSG